MRCKYRNCKTITRHPQAFYWRKWQLCFTHAKQKYPLDYHWKHSSHDKQKTQAHSQVREKAVSIVDKILDKKLYNILNYIREIHFLIRVCPILENFWHIYVENDFSQNHHYKTLYHLMLCSIINYVHSVNDLSLSKLELKNSISSDNYFKDYHYSKHELHVSLNGVTNDLNKNPEVLKHILLLGDDERRRIVKTFQLNFITKINNM